MVTKIADIPGAGKFVAATWVDDDRLAYGGSNQEIQIYSTEKSQFLESCKLHSSAIVGMSLTKEKRLLTGSFDGAIKKINVDEPVRRAGMVNAHQAKAAGLKWKPDGDQIATSGWDGMVKIWNVGPLALVHEMKGHRHRYVHDVVWDKEGSHLVSIDHFGSLRIWDPVSGELISSRNGPIQGFIKLDRQPQGDRIAVSGKQVHVIDPETMDSLVQNAEKGSRLYAAFSPDGRKLGAVSMGKVVFLDASTGRTYLVRGKGQEGGGSGAAWSPNGKLFAAGGSAIQIYDALKYKVVARLSGHRSATGDVQFHPTGTRIASVGGDGNLIIWDAATGDMMLQIPVSEEGGLKEVEWSPDGRRIAVTDSAGNLWVWGSTQMPRIPKETDYLEDGILRSVKTDEDRLAELKHLVEANPDDLGLLREKIALLEKTQRWDEALVDVVTYMERSPDAWRLGRGLLIAKMCNDEEQVAIFAKSCLNNIREGRGSVISQTQAAMALSLAPEEVEDFTTVLEVAKANTDSQSEWPLPLLLSLYRTKQFDELQAALKPHLALGEPSSQKAIALLLETLRLHHSDQPKAARDTHRQAQSVINELPWEGYVDHINELIVCRVLEREIEKTLRSEEPTGDEESPREFDQESKHQKQLEQDKVDIATITNSIGMELIHVPAGEFLMGSPLSDSEHQDDEVQHLVRLSEPFYLATHEVTVGQFRQFTRETDYVPFLQENDNRGWGYDSATDSFKQQREFNWENTGWPNTDKHPVVNVAYTDAVAFCRWLSDKERTRYRLPTEAEWEYACRAGSTTRFSFGDDPEELVKFGNVADAAAKARFKYFPAIEASDGYVFTAPVGSFRPNAWGFHDMHGNVLEWCRDDYLPYPSRDVKDPLAKGDTDDRVVRGGSWYYGYNMCRSAKRAHLPWDKPANNCGFRCVRQIDAASADVEEGDSDAKRVETAS